MRFLSFLLFLFSFTLSFSQERIDGTFNFQTDPEKQYSIYIPSSYDANVPNKMMVGLHPFNTNRWNSISWCDTLIAFAEANNLLMICPDGGIDGKIDDPIDTAFTTFMIDSMLIWYNIDISKIYAMGFSWGGRTTYSYGLNHVDRFAGFMPIGAAITNTNEVNSILNHAAYKPFYIVHGSNDNPNVRFYPIRDALMDEEACVETNLLSGVGHTIDFPNRNAILTEAFIWLDSVNCSIVNDVPEVSNNLQLSVYPNPATDHLNIELIKDDILEPVTIKILHYSGKEVRRFIKNLNESTTVPLNGLNSGIYLLQLEVEGKIIGVERVLVK